MSTHKLGKPWLDDKGKLLSTEALKEASQKWCPQIWEEYLQTLEVPLREKLLEPRLYDELAARQVETVFQKFCITADSPTKVLVQDILAQLSPMQKTVIQKIFFDGMSERQVAVELGITRSTVYVRKKEALARIKRSLNGGTATLPYIGEHVTNPKDPFQKIDEFYHEGSLTKDERDRLWALAELGGIKEGDVP